MDSNKGIMGVELLCEVVKFELGFWVFVICWDGMVWYLFIILIVFELYKFEDIVNKDFDVINGNCVKSYCKSIIGIYSLDVFISVLDGFCVGMSLVVIFRVFVVG